MEIPTKLQLSYQWRRRDLQDGAAVFMRQEEPPNDTRRAEVQPSPMYYGGRDMMTYMIHLPIPYAKNTTGCVIVQRPSKNRYAVAAWVGEIAELFSASSTEEIVRIVERMEAAEKAQQAQGD